MVKELRYFLNTMLPLFPIVTFERTTVLLVALGILYESILSCALAEFLTAGSSSSTSRLQIDFPPSLTKKEGYKHSKADFGFPSYSGSISLQIIYADSDLCNPNSIDIFRGYPVKKDGWFHQRPWGSWGPYILLVNDGGLCSYVQKVRNSQHVGASGVLIAPLPSDNSTNSNNNDPSNDATFQLPHGAMMDDGSGGDVTIPSFYMTMEDSDAIKKELIADVVVLAQMSWFSTVSTTKVQYDLWTASPLDETFIKFAKNFKDTAMALKDYTQFEPHSYIHDGSQYSCVGTNNCESLCTNYGRYCASDPDGDLSEGISGKDIVLESLRRKCIWKHYGSSWGGGEEWWRYVSLFADQCANPTNFTNEGCVREVYHQVGINVKAMVQCMDDSGSLTDDIPNALLDEEIKARSAFGVITFPSIFINGIFLRAAVSPHPICQAICESLGSISDEIDTCQQCMPKSTISIPSLALESTNTMSTAALTAAANKSHETFYKGLIGVIIGLTAVTAVGLWVKSRLHIEAMQGQVRGILAHYMSCDGQDTDQQQELELNPASTEQIRYGVVGISS